MDAFQIDWWREELEKIKSGKNIENKEYFGTFYKNMISATSQIDYLMEMKRAFLHQKFVSRNPALISKNARDEEFKQHNAEMFKLYEQKVKIESLISELVSLGGFEPDESEPCV